MRLLRLWLLVLGSLLALAGCELEKGPSGEPPPAPVPPADVVSETAATPSPDRLIFSSGADEPDLEVYTAFRDGSGRTRLTRNLDGDSGAVAYPNTGLVYYVCGRSENICVANTLGTGTAGVVSSQRIGFPIIEDPAISPDGSKMLFTGIHISEKGDSTNYDIYLYDFATEEITNFAVGAAQDQMAAWASDTDIVWSRLRNGDYDLVTFTLGGPRGSAPVTLTNNDLDDLGADVSADGSTLSFISVKGGDGTLHTMPFTGRVGTPSALAPVPLERGFIGGDPDTAWSPDGDWIAYAATEGESDVEIYTIAASGGTPTNVTNNSVYDVDPEWALLPPSFSVFDPPSYNEFNAANDPLVFEIVLDAPRSERLTVDYTTVAGTAASGTDFTPTSGTATFEPGQTRVRVQVRITDDRVIEPMESLSLRISNSSAGTLIGRDEADAHIADDEVEPTPTPTASAAPTPSVSPSASPGMERIAFTSSRSGQQQLYTMNADGSNVKHISPDQSSSTLSAPSWSRDGLRVIYTALNTGGAAPQPEVMDRPSDGSGSFSMLVLHASMDTDPVYRPGDSAQAFVWASDRDGDFEIYYSTSGSSTVKKLTNNSFDDGAPSFSGDGKYIAYQSDSDGDFDIYRLEVSAAGDPVGSPLNLTDEAAGQSASNQLAPDYAWSQNKITYHSNQHGDLDIFVIDVPTRATIHVTHEVTDEFLPTFSPSGSQLAFVRSVGGNQEIFVAPPQEAATSVNITNDPSADSSPDWGPR